MDDSNEYMEEEYENENDNEDNINMYEEMIFRNNKNNESINKINKLYYLLNLYNNTSLYNAKPEKEKENIRTNNIINILIYIFSGYNIKLKETPNLNNIFNSDNDIKLQNNIDNINLILKFLNSKFLIKNNISNEEYFLLTIYFIDYFDVFKDLLDFLKSKHNESFINFNNFLQCLDNNDMDIDTNNNNNEFNCEDNLKKIETMKSNSVLESYNKLHFIISNIKKQLDNLINKIYKLNEMRVDKSLDKYKIEELLLFSNELIFNNYRNNILYSNQNDFINKYLINIIEAIKLYPDLYDILNKEAKNYNFSNSITNNGHIIYQEKNHENNKVDKTKLNIIQRLFELKYDLNNFNMNNFSNFFKHLQNKIDYNISEIKNKNNEINNSEFTQMLNKVLLQLNNYISNNIIDLNNMIQSNINIDNILKEIENSQKMFLQGDNKDIWEIYSQYLFCVKDYLEIFYKKNMININQIIKNKENIINKDYIILNKEK